VTTARFSANAREFAKNKPITLVDGDLLLSWVQAHGFNAQRAARTQGPFDPYAELGVQPNATEVEVKSAYKAMMALYHPDRVQHLGPELQEVAKRKAQALNRAYELLKQRNGWR
jgi:DnaJ-domain-containing protein 1